MTSPYRLHCLLAAALWAAACQRDADALFDDSGLAATSGSASGGSRVAEAGTATASDGGAADPEGGAPATGGKPNSGGSSGTTSDDAGQSTGGAVAVAGKASGGTGGASTSGAGGGGGTKPTSPMPVTYETRELEDAQLASCRPLENFGSEPSFTVDASGSGGPGVCGYEALLSAPLDALPKDITIQSATLTLSCTDAGDAVEVFYADGAWQEQEVTWLKRPERGASLGVLTCEEAGPVTFDLTTAMQAWASGSHPAHGIYLTTQGENGSDFASSEAKAESQRPLLSVVYLPEN